jgi:hypothetical protein
VCVCLCVRVCVCVCVLQLPLEAFGNLNYKIVGTNMKKRNSSTFFDGIRRAGMTAQLIQASTMGLCILQLRILTYIYNFCCFVICTGTNNVNVCNEGNVMHYLSSVY